MTVNNFGISVKDERKWTKLIFNITEILTINIIFWLK